MELILGVILGAIGSWLISHRYYTKGSKEQIALFNKLSADVRTAILRNPSDVIRHEELVAILEELKNGPVDAKRLTGPIDGGTW